MISQPSLYARVFCTCVFLVQKTKYITEQGGSYVLDIGGGGPTVGSRNLGTNLGEAGIIILIHCAIMLLKILNVYCLK